MALRSKLRRDQLGSRAQQKAAKFKKKPSVRLGTHEAQQKAKQDPLAFTPARGKPSFPKVAAVQGAQLPFPASLGPSQAFPKAQAQAQPQVTEVQPLPEEPKKEPKGFGKLLDPEFLKQEFKRETPEEVRENLKAVGVAGAAAATIFGPGLAAAAGRIALARMGTRLTATGIQRLSTTSGVSVERLTFLVEKARVRTAVREIAGLGGSGIVKSLTGSKLAKMGWSTVKGIASADILVSWYALDNVINGQVFYLKQLLSSVQSGTINPSEALELADEARSVRDIAKGVVNFSTMLNPVLWPFRNLMMRGVEGHEEAIELTTQGLEQAAQGFSQPTTLDGGRR